MNADEEEEENPYEALRKRNIARNEARLASLGLLGPTPTTKASLGNKRTTRSTPKKIAKPPEKIPVRRSTRTQRTPIISYKEDPLLFLNPKRAASAGSLKGSTSQSPTFVGDLDQHSAAPAESVPSNRKTTAMQRTTTTPNIYSARNLSLDTHNLVSCWLAKPMTTTGKRAVMEEMTRQFSDATFDQRQISFNKYCGVQKWKRGIFLWVNLGGPNNDVVNQFLGQSMTWYGGSRMHEQSPPILRLLQAGKRAAEEHNHEDGIVLWCRRYLPEKRTFGPYYCFGKLAYVSHDNSSNPISFVWNLVDYDNLIAAAAKEDNVVLQMIQQNQG